MKKLVFYFFLLFSIYSKATQVQIDFVSGFNIDVINQTQQSPSVGSATTDTQINVILSNYNINNCLVYYDNQHAYLFVDYFGNQLNNLRNDLLNNSNVSKTWVCYTYPSFFTFADRLYVTLIDNTNGNPIGNTNGIVVTTNSTLNSIFSQYQVTSMLQLVPNSKFYQIFFEGDITGLKNQLDSLTSLIDTSTDPTNLVGVPMLLNNSDFNTIKVNVAPNPFSDKINIQTEEQISNYILIDISGKQLINTISKNELDKIVYDLKSDVYFLHLQFENSQSHIFKIIKE